LEVLRTDDNQNKQLKSKNTKVIKKEEIDNEFSKNNIKEENLN
jgi:hypothetical protein